MCVYACRGGYLLELHSTYTKRFFSHMYIIRVYHMYSDAFRVQQRVLGPLELELQAFVSSPTWVLGTELRSSAGPTDALNH